MKPVIIIAIAVVCSVGAISLFLGFNQEIKLATGMQTDEEPTPDFIDDLAREEYCNLYACCWTTSTP